MNIEIGIMIALFIILNMARFTRTEPPNAPIHWLKVELGNSIRIPFSSIMVGIAKDFNESLKLALPQNMLEHRPNTVVAKITLPEAMMIGKQMVDEFMILQSSATNEILGLLEDWAKDKGNAKWKCEEVMQFDTWSSKNLRTIEITHEPVNTAGSRTAYGVVEVTE